MRTDSRPSANTDDIFFHSLVSSSLHEICKQSIQDVSLLMFHQMAADALYNEDIGKIIPVDEQGKYILYSPEEEKKLREQLINVVMRFHTFDENGIGNRLTPLINNVLYKKELDSQAKNDPVILNVLEGHSKFRQTVYNGDIKKILEQITDVNIQDFNEKVLVTNSYKDTDMIDVAVYEDDNVQCSCPFCEGFFQILEKKIDMTKLNPLQQIFAEKYDFIAL